MRLCPVLILLWSFAASGILLWSADSTFRHPENFTILVPDGWKAESQAAGIAVSKGSANVDVFVIPGNGSPESLIQSIEPQLAKQWRSWNPVRNSSCTVAGRNGACAWYSGINPKGEAMNFKMAALAEQGKGYVLFVETPQQNANAFMADVARIERSFSPVAGQPVGAAPPIRPVDPQKLAALDKAYQEGQMTTEEYERRKQQLQGGTAESSAAPNAGTQPQQTRQPPRVQTPENSPPATEPQHRSPPQNSEPPASPEMGSPGGQRFLSPDGFFATSIPQGWTNVPAGPMNNGAYLFAPSNRGTERIMVGSGQLYVTGIQQVLSSAFVTIRTLYPGLQLAGRPSYFNVRNLPAAQLNMRGFLANGAPATAWYGLVLARNRYFYVFSVAPPRTAAQVEQDARAVFGGFQF